MIPSLSWWKIFMKPQRSLYVAPPWYVKIFLRDKMSPRRYETGVRLLRVFLAAYCFWRRRKLVFQCSCLCLLGIRVCFARCLFNVLKNNLKRSGATHYSWKKFESSARTGAFSLTLSGRECVRAGCGSIFAVDRGSSPINSINRTNWASERETASEQR